MANRFCSPYTRDASRKGRLARKGVPMYWKSAATLSIVFAVFTGSVAAQCGQAANSNLISYLGSAGPTNFTVLSLGGNGAVVNINLATVAGNVGVPNFGTIKESAPSSV